MKTCQQFLSERKIWAGGERDQEIGHTSKNVPHYHYPWDYMGIFSHPTKILL